MKSIGITTDTVSTIENTIDKVNSIKSELITGLLRFRRHRVPGIGVLETLSQALRMIV